MYYHHNIINSIFLNKIILTQKNIIDLIFISKKILSLGDLS